MSTFPVAFPSRRRQDARRSVRIFRNVLTSLSTECTPGELGQTALVFSPHPDDEALGCGGTIIRKTRAGASVTLVHMTDGGASTDLVTREQLTAIRRRECLEAAQALGVTATIFLDYEDRKLWDAVEPATERVTDIVAAARPEQVFVPYRNEPARQAADHLAATYIVLLAVLRSGRPVTVWEYPVWAWLHWPWVRLRQPGPLMRTKHLLWNSGRLLFGARALADWRRTVDISAVAGDKRKAIAQHRSQTERIVAHPGYMTLGDVCQGEFLECFHQDREYFRVYRYPEQR